MFKKFIQRIIEAENKEDAVQNVFLLRGWNRPSISARENFMKRVSDAISTHRKDGVSKEV